MYLLILIGILFYAIVALIVRKKTEHAAALCPAHVRRRNRFVLGAFAAFFAGLFGARIRVARKMDDRYVRFRGASSAFLDSLPVFPVNRRR